MSLQAPAKICTYCHNPIAHERANMNRNGSYCHYECREAARQEQLDKFKGGAYEGKSHPHDA